MFMLLVLILIGLVKYRWWLEERRHRMTLLERCGINGPVPHLIKGNLDEVSNMSNVTLDQSLIERYGSICGYYIGAKPMILISDPDIIEMIQTIWKLLCLDRPRKVPGGISPDPKRKLMLGNLAVSEWRSTRSIMSPAFRSSNLKMMLPDIEQKVEILLYKIEQTIITSSGQDQNQVDLYPLFQSLTLDIIGKVAFGLHSTRETSIQTNKNVKLSRAIEAEFSKSTSGFLIKLFLCFPEFAPVLRRVREIWHNLKEKMGLVGSSELWDLGRAALHERRAIAQGSNSQGGESHYPDLLHHLMSDKSKLSDDQIVANSVLMFEAAYETTSSCLAFLVHLMAHHPQIQHDIREEIKRAVGNGVLEDYAVLNDLPTLEAAILEALRLYPPQTTFIGRSSEVDLQFTKDGVEYTIPKGVHIQVGLTQTHRDKKLWEDPNKFVPGRFLEVLENGNVKVKSTGTNFAYQSFGHGPRECIGKGFALMSIKYISAKLISLYELRVCDKTENLNEIKITYKTATMTPSNGSFVQLIPVR